MASCGELCGVFTISASSLLSLEPLLTINVCGPYLAFTLLSVLYRKPLTSAFGCKWREMIIAESTGAEKHRGGEMGG